MSYISQHTNRIGKKFTIPWLSLEPGMVVEVSYRKLPDKNGIRQVKTYLMLVMHPGKWGGVKHTHCLKMENVSISVIKYLVKTYGVIDTKSLQKVRRINLPLLDIGNPKYFYLNEIKGESKFEDTYRTLILGSLLTIRAIDYNFEQ